MVSSEKKNMRTIVQATMARSNNAPDNLHRTPKASYASATLRDSGEAIVCAITDSTCFSVVLVSREHIKCTARAWYATVSALR